MLLHKIQKLVKSFLTNNWTVTLVATMIGVFAGIYMNNYYNQQAVNQNTQLALEKIKSEIKANQKTVQESFSTHKEYIDILSFVFENLDESDKVVVPSQKMNAFQRKHPHTLILEDSVLVEEGVYAYHGTLNINFNSVPSVQISNIAWETFKNSQLPSILNFDCIYFLSFVDKLQEQVREENNTVLKIISEDLDDREKGGQRLISKWTYLIDLEKTLLDLYDTCEEQMKSCF